MSTTTVLTSMLGTSSTALAGAVFCVSGTLSLGKKEMAAFLEAHGAAVASSVTAKVTHVLTSAADAAKKTSKIASAEAKNIPVIGESFVVASITSGALVDASDHHPVNSIGCKRDRESGTPPSELPMKKLQRKSAIAAAGEAALQDGELCLLSATDGCETRVPLAAVTQSSTLDHASDKLNTSQAVPIPASTPLIVKLVEWMQHEWHRCTHPISTTDHQDFINDYFSSIKTSDDFVQLLTLGDFMQVDSLVDATLSTLFHDVCDNSAASNFRQLHGIVDDIALQRALLNAAKLGDVENFKAAQAKGANINATDKDSCTALHLAAKHGRLEMAKYMLAQGVNVDAVDNDGETPLVAALGRVSSKELLEVLLKAGAQINLTDDDGATPLHMAAAQEHRDRQEYVELLLAAGAKAELTDTDGQTAFECALLQAVNVRNSAEFSSGAVMDEESQEVFRSNPEQFYRTRALECLDDPVVKVLHRSCGGTLCINDVVSKVARQFIDDESDEEEQEEDNGLMEDSNPCTANDSNPLIHLLTNAITPAALSWVQLELCDNICLRLMSWADAERNRRLDRTEECKLSNAMKRENLTGDQKSQLNKDLWQAVATSDVVAAQIAFNRGADPEMVCEMPTKSPSNVNVPDTDLGSKYADHSENEDEDCPSEEKICITPLMLATQRNDAGMINWLCDVGSDINAAQPIGWEQGDEGWTALWRASSLATIRELCARGADPNAQVVVQATESDEERTGGWMLVSDVSDGTHFGTDPVAKCLVRHGADFNEVTMYYNRDGGYRNFVGPYWPTVVKSGDVAWAAEMIECYGADPNWPVGVHGEEWQEYTVAGPTVLLEAIQQEDETMVEMLLDKGADPNLAEVLDFSGLGAAIDDGEGLDPEFVIPPEKKATPLSVAMAIGNKTIINLLRERGASSKPENRSKPFDAFNACEGIALEAFNRLLEHLELPVGTGLLE